MSVNFHLLAYSTTMNIFLNEFIKSWPPIVLSYEVEGFENAGVSHYWEVVVGIKNFASECEIIWNVYAFVEDH